ncbi:hypothetical protein [Myroides odoratimimus]|uniref:hypothetical protein n=1 Tax=Myroides odoratimimus TaxID=76832 RepID=UPI001CE21A21|nr:hypothetical protein [Myroides odoratimimus]MCA4806856.1 hypothetical protein [Myroides odoratimimus]MCS7474196.1 hypothetical protein [Myroides odoratimimus]MDM1086544.1 hypothetical protein [Myroides odoratimimus]MDM1398602.1 hypothetical protein [Myroides odoratimimus]MDM1530360.1 hypothetical protein [Myroides odoratimimus]
MMKYNELLINEESKTMQLFKGLSEEEDRELTLRVGLLIKQGKRLRMQVVADDIDEFNVYLEGYDLVDDLL